MKFTTALILLVSSFGLPAAATASSSDDGSKLIRGGGVVATADADDVEALKTDARHVNVLRGGVNFFEAAAEGDFFCPDNTPCCVANSEECTTSCDDGSNCVLGFVGPCENVNPCNGGTCNTCSNSCQFYCS